MKVYDLIIIGAGPAGLSAGIYAGRAKLDTLIIEKAQAGGQILQTSEIENSPGSVPEESGAQASVPGVHPDRYLQYPVHLRRRV